MLINALAVSDFRKQLSTAFLNGLKNNPLILLSHSKPVAVVIDYQEYEAMQAELELLRERHFQTIATRLRETMKNRKLGDTAGMMSLSQLSEIFELKPRLGSDFDD